MAQVRAWSILEVEAAGTSRATPAIVQADSSVAQTSLRWHKRMDTVGTHWRNSPDDTCPRQIGTCQMLR